MKKMIAALAAVLMLTAGLSACGGEQDAEAGKATEDTAAVATSAAETTVVVEKTADGGTIEKDSENNELEIDKNGKLVSVKDKNGNDVDVTEYTVTHYIVTSGGSVIGSADDTRSGDSSSKSEGSSSKSDDSSSKSEGSSSKSGDSSSKSEGSSSKSEEGSSKFEPEPDNPESEPETIALDEYELPIVR